MIVTFTWHNIHAFICYSVSAPKETCGGLINRTTGWITAPDFDSDRYYDYNIDCVWVIEVRRQNVLVMHFLYFDVEYNIECSDGDVLKVRSTECTFNSKFGVQNKQTNAREAHRPAPSSPSEVITRL